MTRRSTSEGLVSAIRVTAGLWCVNHEQGVRSERVHDRVDVPAGCGSTPGSSDCARVGPLSSRLTAKREDVGARAFGTSGNARMHGCEQRELRRQSPTALCSDGASGAAHRGPCRSTWLRAYHPSHSHPSSLVSCLTVGRDASRDISASATLTQPLSLALMSPDGSDRERSPLEPVKDNILLAQPVRSPLIALQFGNRRWRARGTFIEIRAVFGCFPGSHLSRDTRHAACDGMAHAACAPRAAAGRDPRTPRGPPRPAASPERRRATGERRCRGSIFSVIEDMLIIMTRTPHTHITHVHTTHVCYKIHICAT